MLDHNASVLLIYTGGTIGMIENPETGILESFDFNHLKECVPELKRFKFSIDTIQFNPPIDSSDMDPDRWCMLVRIIEDNYNHYDGFVILHGTDTMAYSASALSFMLENLDKPVILTGSQLPVGKIRTDGKENLITALEIAVDKDAEGKAIVPEVCIFFQNYLMRGNRTTKINVENFKAFNSYNYPVLAVAGTQIRYEHHLIRKPSPKGTQRFHYWLDPNVMILKIFPGISKDIVQSIFDNPQLKGVVLETYGAGNAPERKDLLEIWTRAVKRGVVILNVSQCAAGTVEMNRYKSGKILADSGVFSGYDMTTEAAVTKLMFLFGHEMELEQVKQQIARPLIGEVSIIE
ncbi:MAG: asparaginase [Dysgonamonadaceae bacterium]|jgi:L-asparaginase|nr:asparaginase [Dysgonamonadaceae bacterium]